MPPFAYIDEDCNYQLTSASGMIRYIPVKKNTLSSQLVLSKTHPIRNEIPGTLRCTACPWDVMNVAVRW